MGSAKASKRASTVERTRKRPPRKRVIRKRVIRFPCREEISQPQGMIHRAMVHRTMIPRTGDRKLSRALYRMGGTAVDVKKFSHVESRGVSWRNLYAIA